MSTQASQRHVKVYPHATMALWHSCFPLNLTTTVMFCETFVKITSAPLLGYPSSSLSFPHRPFLTQLRQFGSLCRPTKLLSSRPHHRHYNLAIHFSSGIFGHSQKHPRNGTYTGCRSSWCVRHHPIGHYGRKS